MSRLARSACLLTLGLAAGCAELPVIARSECGNRVIEANEDCDTLPPYAGAVCRAPNTIGECHLDCTRRDDGSENPCPAGWGCDFNGVCRAPSGSFEPIGSFRAPGAFGLYASDFDGDGHGDVVSRSAPNQQGESLLQVHYFDESGALRDTRSFDRAVRAARVGAFSSDSQSDLLFGEAGLGLVLGRADRTLVPEAFSIYVAPGAGVRVVSIHPGNIGYSAVLLIMTSFAAGLGIYAIDGNDGMIKKRSSLPLPVEMLADEPVVGQLLEASPCLELVHAYVGHTSFTVTDGCTRDPVSGQLTLRAQAEQLEVALEPPLAITRGPQIGDLNGDGHQDVVLGSDTQTYVAYGHGDHLDSAVPYRPTLGAAPELPGQASDIPTPLALADFSGDGLIDMVLPSAILVSSVGADGGLRHALTHVNKGAPWTVARVGELNGNAHPDVVAASRHGSGFDFFSGTGSQTLIPFRYPTAAAVKRIALGDFDGDTLGDIALAQVSVGPSEQDELAIAYGTLLRPPEEPRLAARIHDIELLATHRAVGLYDHLAVCSSDQSSAGVLQRGVATWLSGSPERVPLATYDLAQLQPKSSVIAAQPISIVQGAFTAPGTRELIVLGANDAARSFWLTTGLGGAHIPRLLTANLDARFSPSELAPQRVVHVDSAAADLDHDGRDEAVFVMPADQRSHCGVAIFDLDPALGSALRSRGALVLEQPCPDPQLATVDVDGDQHVDLALLTGARGGGERKLWVLWNDGLGGFSTTQAALVNAVDESPQAFTVLPRSPARPLSLAYVTEQAARIASLVEGQRTFLPSVPIASLRRATGIATSDVSGDGIDDLVIADGGELRVLRAFWAQP